MVIDDADLTALIDTSNHTTRTLTYKQLNELSNSIAQFLIEKGCKVNDRIALMSLNSIECIAWYLGILKIGATVVFINPNLPVSQIDYTIKNSDARLLITDSIIDLSIETIRLDLPIKALEFSPYEIDEQIPAVILYTSGSTGNPKGVVISRASHRWAVTQRRSPHLRQVTTLIATPMYHMSGLSNIGLALASQSIVVLMPKFEAATAIELIQQHRISRITAVPTMIALILKEKVGNLTSVKYVSMGSSPVSEKLYADIKRSFPSARIVIHYGLTEAGPGLFAMHPDGIPTPELSVGYPNPNISYRLVDGMLHIRTPMMMTSYTNFASESVTEDGYFITKDLFRIDEQGFYFFVGRADDMFVCGGNNIYPTHIEEILELHPMVVTSAVIGIDDDVKGVKPYAFVELSANALTTATEITEYLTTKLPYSHIPRQVWIVDHLPLNHVNKVDKVELKSRAKNLLSL